MKYGCETGGSGEADTTRKEERLRRRSHAAMDLAAWWTCACALLVISHARLYERCELARDLRALGVHPNHISTWVCIAYHESRFDTAANNPHSGDHGLFQISELYWCGPGKACSLPCSDLRDDDITDDLECALRVHEEHTRLQGDGFLAWVVYPQHCRHNTKKYLIDCDENLKNVSVSNQVRSFNSIPAYDNRHRTNAINRYSNNPDIDSLLPPYLAVSSIFRGSYGKVLDYNKFNGVDWYNYKHDKVDELKLPNFATETGRAEVSTTSVITTTTTTSTTPYVPPIKPWRFIETNQFRKKALSLDTTTSTPTTKQSYIAFERQTPSSSTYRPTEPTTHKSFTTVTIPDVSEKVKSATISHKSASALTSTTKPVQITNTAYKVPVFVTSYKSQTTTYKPPTTIYKSTGAFDYFTSTSRLPIYTTTTKPKFPVFTNAFPTTTSKPPSSAVITFPTRSYAYRGSNFFTTTVKPTTTTYRTTTKASTTSKTAAPSRSTTPWYTFTSRLRNFGSPTASGYQQLYNATTSIRPSSTQRWIYATTTQKPTNTISTTQRPRASTIKSSASTTPKFVQTTSTPTQRTSRVTQNIFDLYLNPTNPPKLPSFSFSSRSDSKSKISIFSDGTTTTPPSVKLGRVDRNQVRRETS